MSDHEGLIDDALEDEARAAAWERDGACICCGGWTGPRPPVCMACAGRLCDDCAVDYPGGDVACPDCAKEDVERYERIVELAAWPSVTEDLADRADELYDMMVDAAGEDWQPLLDALEKAANMEVTECA